MKRNWFVIAVILLIAVGMWAQVANSAAKSVTDKASSCACCNHDMKDMKSDAKGHDHAGMNHAAMDHAPMAGKDAKDGMACSRKDGKGCCKDGKCTMAKNGQKCCDKCPGMAEGE